MRVVDGLLTGWHEPEASHLQMLEAVAGRRALELAYGAALAAGYRWHEFGDVHLILPERSVTERSSRPMQRGYERLVRIDVEPETERPGVSVPPPVTAAQRSVLYQVRRRGEATVVDVAESLDMTPSGARQHLAALVDDGPRGDRPGTRVAGQQGRTEQVYRMASAAEPLFPHAYGELTNQLLGVRPRRRRDRGVRAPARRPHRRRRAPGWRPAWASGAKVAELARILDEDGYLASVEPIGRDAFRIAERNCAIFAVAREHPQACSTELEFLRAALPEARHRAGHPHDAGRPLVQLRGAQASVTSSSPTSMAGSPPTGIRR